jgi:hypothetical protein
MYIEVYFVNLKTSRVFPFGIISPLRCFEMISSTKIEGSLILLFQTPQDRSDIFSLGRNKWRKPSRRRNLTPPASITPHLTPSLLATTQGSTTRKSGGGRQRQ